MKNKNLNKHKALKLVVATFMSVIMFSLSTVPALAYNLPPLFENGNLSVGSVDMVNVNTNETDSVLISSQPAENDLYSFSENLDFSKSSWYCIDENGIIYNDNSAEPQIIPCNHNFLNAQVSHHTKNSDGSCTVVYHRANRCSKCGYIVVLERIATTTFDKCPH